MLKTFLIFNLVAIVSILLAEEVKNKNGDESKEIVFPTTTENPIQSVEHQQNEDESELKPSPRESKDMKLVRIPNYVKGKRAKPVQNDYDMNDYEEGIIGDVDDDDDDDDNDYENEGRNEPLKVVASEHGKRTNVDNPRIITLRDGLNIFRNFWRNRNPPKVEKEIVPVITYASSPTVTQQIQNEEDFGIATGTATGTGTITAASADEIAQNNAAAETNETPSPFFTLSRRRPVEYEILEEYPDSNLNEHVLAFNSDYIDITGDDDLDPEDFGKAAIPKMSIPIQKAVQMEINKKQQTGTSKRKNTKQPIKVLNEQVNLIEPQIMPPTSPKTGLEFYRQYLPNLRKLIEIRPKFFLNQLATNEKGNERSAGSIEQNNVRKRPKNRRSPQRQSGGLKNPIPNVVGFVDPRDMSKSNRLPVKRVQLYLI